MKKKILGLILAIVLIVGVFPINGYAGVDFTDMPDDWSTEALISAVENGLMIGDNGQIRPTSNILRAELATMINRAFANVEVASITNFTDVPNGVWYYDEMAKAVQMGVFIGSGNKLNPTDNITRQEAFVVLARVLKLETEDTSSLAPFSDRAEVADWAIKSIAALVKEGYVKGSDGKINPNGYLTRREFAQLMYNIFEMYSLGNDVINTDVQGNLIVRSENVTINDITINGNVVIGGGVKNSVITLDKTVINGDLIIRGGKGVTVKINNNVQVAGSIIVDNNDGDTSLDIQQLTVGSGIVKYTNIIFIKDYTGDVIDKTTGGEASQNIDKILQGANYVELSGNRITIGENVINVEKKLGIPNRIDSGIEKYDWYVYNEDMDKYVMIGISEGYVESIFTMNTQFKLNGTINYGETNYATTSGVRYYIDNLNNNQLYGIWINASSVGSNNLVKNFTMLRNTVEKQVLDMTNAFRNINGLASLSNDSIALTTARAHSQDMADNNYFSHTSMDGLSPFQRYAANNNGVNRANAENIAAGYSNSMAFFDAWINSSGHRSNMLNTVSKYIGIGMAYNASSTYRLYMTQLFSY